MARFEFPPPASASGDGWEKVDYPTGDGSGGFIFPPPRGGGSGDLAESTWELGEAVGQWRDQVTSTADEVHNIGEVLVDYGDALDDLNVNRVEPWAVPTVAPLSQTINRHADATFQLQGFMGLDLPLAGNTRGSDGHFHALTGDHADAGRVEPGLARGWAEHSVSYYAFITPAVTRAYSQITFMLDEVVGSSAGSFYYAIYVTDENRVLKEQFRSDLLTGELGLGRSVVTFSFPTFVATQGSYIAVGVEQLESTGPTRPLLGLYEVRRPISVSQYFPPRIAARRTSTAGLLPPVVDGESELDFEHPDAWFVPYIELSENLGTDYRTFTEGWFYNGPQIGRPWVPLTSQGIGSENGYTRPYGSGLRVSMYDTPLSTDYVRIRSSIHRPGTAGRNRRSTLIIRGTNDMRSGVGLSAIGDSHYELIEWNKKNVNSNEEWNDRTLIRTISTPPRAGQAIEVDYLDGYVTVRINGTTYIDEQMVSGPAGAAGRFLGIQSRRQSWITWESSPWFGPWSARDLPQDDDGEDGEEGEEEGEEEP